MIKRLTELFVKFPDERLFSYLTLRWKKRKETFVQLKQPLTMLLIAVTDWLFQTEIDCCVCPTDNLRIPSILIYKQGCNAQNSEQSHSTTCLSHGLMPVQRKVFGVEFRLFFSVQSQIWHIELNSQSTTESLSELQKKKQPRYSLRPSLQTLSSRLSPLTIGWKRLSGTFICWLVVSTICLDCMLYMHLLSLCNRQPKQTLLVGDSSLERREDGKDFAVFSN